MSLAIRERQVEIPRSRWTDGYGLLSSMLTMSESRNDRVRVVRNAVTALGERTIVEQAYLDGAIRCSSSDLWMWSPRQWVDDRSFNVVLVIPTGIGCEIGGHAGDAGPVAIMMGQLCDHLITHPNVVNASDINEMPANTWYVEGSMLSRLLMGTIALRPVRSNRVLVIIDRHPSDPLITDWAINAVHAAMASYGLRAVVHCLEAHFAMQASWTPSGRAGGVIPDIMPLVQVMREHEDQYEVAVITSAIDMDWEQVALVYFDQGGVNPWGGIEAMLTHTLSSIFDVPVFHSPMVQRRNDYGPPNADPRMAAEIVSMTFLNSVLKGAMRAPRMSPRLPEGFSVKDVHAMVIPDGIVGIPTLAAYAQRIPVIAVQENQNVMGLDLDLLKWPENQLIRVANYWEAAGVLAAMRAGIDPCSVRRPLRRLV